MLGETARNHSQRHSYRNNDPELLRIRDRILTAMEGIDDEDPELLLRLERPAPGLAHRRKIGTLSRLSGSQGVYLSVRPNLDQ
jgi:hypothetical protein